MLPKSLLLLTIGLFTSLLSFSQTNKISGTVTDTSSGAKLGNAVVSLIRVKDSVLARFTRTTPTGSFELDQIPSGRYVFLITYPGYADFTDEVELGENSSLQKNITIIPKTKLLQEIIIQHKVSAIRIKGDTTEYKADSFYVGPNANVQELLKRLPGLQVNAKGEIIAQGQKVEKILVDGEEFFSDDPAVVTQNLQAKVVDKVQVFDKKSEQAEFTGVDDGQKTKTINLELKDDKKKGYFGKVEAGTDFDHYRTSKAMINSFKKKQKVAAYVTHNNTTFEGLDWNEQRNYGSNDNSNMEIMEDGGVMMWSNNNDDFTNGEGLPKSTTGGLTYINKWNKDKIALNSNYQFNDQTVTGRNNSITKTILPDTSFTNTTSQVFSTNKWRHKLKTLYDWNIDSATTLKLKLSGTVVNRKNANVYGGESLSEEGQRINSQNRSTTTDLNNQDFTSEVVFKKRFGKPGRTISYTGNFSFNGKSGDGFLNSVSSFYDPLTGTVTSAQSFDQKKTTNERQTVIQNNIVYTEPITKRWNLELNYRNSFGRNDAERNTFEKPVAGDKYTNIVDTLSNHFLFRTTNHSGAFSFRYNYKKITASFGTGVGIATFNLEELNKNYTRSRSFTNLLPKASIRYAPKKQKSISLSYNGSTQNPTLQQINPIIDNIDPLNITLGNPNLKQAFRHSFNVTMNNYKVIKSQSFWMSGNFSFVDNAITSSNTIDASGRRTSQTINTNGNYNGDMWGMYGFEIFQGVNMNFNASGSISRMVNRVNGLQNVTNNYSVGFGTGLGKWNDKWLNFNLNIEPRYNVSRSSINKNAVTKYWSMNAYPYVEMKFKKLKLYANINGEVNMFEKTETFVSQRNVVLLNGSIRKTLTKSEAFEVKLSVNDMFNQNLGIRRNISSNFISESTFQNIRRFWLLSFAWNFSKNGKPSNF